MSRKNALNPPPTRIQINKAMRAIRSGSPRCFVDVGDGEIAGGVAGGRFIGDWGDTLRPTGMGVANCGSESGRLMGPLIASALTGGKVERSLEMVSALGDITKGDSEAAGDEEGEILDDGLMSWVGSDERLLSSAGEMACFKSSGMGRLNACATAAVMAAALENRCWGSLARPLRRTGDNAGGSCGFRRRGSAGISKRCCIMMPVILSPWNGGTPVNTS